MENRIRSPPPLPLPKPSPPADSALKPTHTSYKFHLVRVVFSCSVLRIHIIQTSYLHYIGFHQHNSYKRFFYSAPVICVEILLRRTDCKVMGRMLESGEQTQSHFFLLIQETSVREEKGLA